MEEKLSGQDWEMILESLKYTKIKFEEYDKYPSYEFKQKKNKEIDELIAKVTVIKEALKV